MNHIKFLKSKKRRFRISYCLVSMHMYFTIGAKAVAFLYCYTFLIGAVYYLITGVYEWSRLWGED